MSGDSVGSTRREKRLESNIAKLCKHLEVIEVMCNETLGSTMTHGQKNGVLVLISSIAEKRRLYQTHCPKCDGDVRDIPF